MVVHHIGSQGRKETHENKDPLEYIRLANLSFGNTKIPAAKIQ